MASLSAASSPPGLRTLIRRQRTQFPLLRNSPEKWCLHRFTNAYFLRRFTLLPAHRDPPSHPPLSLRNRLLRPRPPLRSLFQPRPPPLRHSLSLMTTGAASDSAQSSTAKTVKVVIKGRVQGVFYRNWTIENATQLGLKGWVRNRRDGSVEALFSGSAESVQEMEQRCRRGPPDALVTGLQVFPSTEDPGTEFERRRTV